MDAFTFIYFSIYFMHEPLTIFKVVIILREVVAGVMVVSVVVAVID